MAPANMEFVDLKDSRVDKAIEFVEDQIELCLEKFSQSFSKKKLEKVPWIHYSPALTSEEERERQLLIEKYGASRPDQIEYYLLYHNCDDFAVFYWTVLRVNGIPTRILSQERPFRHTYLQKQDGEIVDALLSYCGVPYPYRPEDALKFETPQDFYAEVFISEDPQAWEIEVLEQLKNLE